MLDLNVHPVALLEDGIAVSHFTNIALAVITGAQRGYGRRRVTYSVREGAIARPVSDFSVQRIQGCDVFKGLRVAA